MPEPIIEPATSMVESSKPNPRTNFSSLTADDCDMRFAFEPSDRAELITSQPDWRNNQNTICSL